MESPFTLHSSLPVHLLGKSSEFVKSLGVSLEYCVDVSVVVKAYGKAQMIGSKQQGIH
jgi:hypothetical protein